MKALDAWLRRLALLVGCGAFLAAFYGAVALGVLLAAEVMGL